LRGRSIPATLVAGANVTPDAIKALRTELGCTAKELAAALTVDQATVLAWERGELFPTKRHVTAMAALAQKGAGAVPRKAKGADPMKALADPQVWELLRKLTAHKKLRDEVTKLAAGYSDPAASPDGS
jgi:transcriptional regulator with XRE-family HTH domain